MSISSRGSFALGNTITTSTQKTANTAWLNTNVEIKTSDLLRQIVMIEFDIDTSRAQVEYTRDGGTTWLPLDDKNNIVKGSNIYFLITLNGQTINFRATVDLYVKFFSMVAMG